MKILSPDTSYEVLRDYCIRKNLKLHISDCSFCKYPVGFIWINGELHYDSGCDCLVEKIVEPRKEKELIEFIRQNPGRVRRIMPLLVSITH